MDDFSDEDLIQAIVNLPDLYSSPLEQYCPHRPTPHQEAFLRLQCLEALYGGAAGGGKSDAQLMAALQYVDVPGYSAIIFRRTYQDLALADGLIPRSHEWLTGKDARYAADTHTWHFPSGATVAFGYMDGPNDHYRYQGSAYQFIGWEELTQFEEYKYLFMFSRMRALEGSSVPLRVRSTSNPGGIGHRWVKRRFIDTATKETDAVYVPAKLSDNPHLRADYAVSLSYLDSVTRARYLNGDWSVIENDVFVYPFDRAVHVESTPSRDPNYYRRRVVGADPGKSDPYAVPVLCEDYQGVWWVVEEFYRTGGTSSQWQNEFQRMHAAWKPSRWYVDKRKPSDIIDLIRAGIPAVPNIDVHGENERDTIRPMIGVVQDLLIAGKLKVDPSCKQTIYEFEEYRYREAEDRNSGEVPMDVNNHAMDAIRYGLCSVLVPGDRRPRIREGGVGELKALKAPRKPGDPLPGIPSRNAYLKAQDEALEKRQRDLQRGQIR